MNGFFMFDLTNDFYFDTGGSSVYNPKVDMVYDADLFNHSTIVSATKMSTLEEGVSVRYMTENPEDIIFRTKKTRAFTNNYVNIYTRTTYSFKDNALVKVPYTDLHGNMIDGANFWVPSSETIVFLNMHDLVSSLRDFLVNLSYLSLLVLTRLTCFV